MQKKLSLLLAALFMAASVNVASALDYDEDAPHPVISLHSDDADDAEDIDEAEDADAAHPLNLGHPYHWRRGMMRGHGPQMMPGMRMRGPGMQQRGPGMRGFGRMGMMRDLDLTQAQKTQMIDAMVDNYRQRLTLRMDMADAMQKLRDEYESDTPNRANIVALNQKMGELKGKIDILGHEYVDKVQNMLTPEQKEKMKSHLDRFEKRIRDGKRGERGDRSPRGPRTMRGPGPRAE